MVKFITYLLIHFDESKYEDGWFTDESEGESEESLDPE